MTTSGEILMKSLSEEHVLEALRVVKDPDLHKDIVTLGFVKNLAITGNDVSFSLELTTPSCPVRDELKDAASRALHDAIQGIGEVTVTMTSSVTQRTRPQHAELLPGRGEWESRPLQSTWPLPLRGTGHESDLQTWTCMDRASRS